MTKLEFEKLLKPLVKIIDDIEIDLIYNVLERIDNYKDVKGSLKWYNDKLKELKLLEKDNKNTFKERKKRIKDVIEEIAKVCGTKIDNFDKLEDYYNQGLLNVNPINLYNSVSINNLINEAIKDGNDIMNLIQTKALESSKKEYMNILNKAYTETASGAYTYTESIRNAIDKMSENGIAAVHYKNGVKLSIESVVRRDIVTRMNKLVGDVEIQQAKELGTNLVYVDQHLGARVRTPYMKNDYEAHCEWQGKKYMIEGSNEKYDNLYEKTGYGEMLGLKGINCYHNMKPTFEWEKIPDRIDETENKKEYELLQQQRAFERKMRKLKRKRESYKATNDEQLDKASQKYKQESEKFNKWLKENNLTRDYEREYIENSSIKVEKLSSISKIENNNKIFKEFLGNIKGKNFFSEIEKYENQIFKNENENAIIIEKSGDVYKFIGSNDYVNIDCDFENAIITHNHPTFEGELGGSFSEDDFKLLVRHQNIKELRAVDEKYIYTTRILNKIKEYDYMEAMLNVVPKDNEDFKHLIFEELKKKGLIEYERKLRNGTK